jgi:hypothetical protein
VKIRSRGRVWLASVMAALMVGGALLLWQGKDPAVTASVKIIEPDSDELRTFASTRVFFGHQSVGGNVISGLAPTFEAAGRPAPTVVETRESPGVESGVLHAHIGANGDPLGKFRDFADIVNGTLGDDVDVALLKLCYVDVVATTDVDAVFSAYSEMMAELESKHPSVRFLYATVPLSTDRGWKAIVKSWIGRDDQMGPADNIARERYNDLVRARYGSSGRLFDIAAVEATMSVAPTRRDSDGRTYYVLNDALAADPGHLNELGSRLAAAELIRVVAGARS